MLTAIIDADILIYEAAAGAQHTIDWGDDVEVEPVADEQEAINLLNQKFDDTMARTWADDAVMCLSVSSDEGWRKKVLPSYKENRSTTKPPILRPFLKTYVQEHYKSYLRPEMEGDDIYGILMTHPSIIKGDKVGCSIDKDMKTIPGRHFNLTTKEFFDISPEEADYWHMFQTLTGDTTDGYKGCPGVGKVAAEKLLRELIKPVSYPYEMKRGARKGEIETRWDWTEAASMWEVVLALYHKAGLTEADALVQARVARICRHTDYDFANKKVILWTPPTI